MITKVFILRVILLLHVECARRIAIQDHLDLLISEHGSHRIKRRALSKTKSGDGLAAELLNLDRDGYLEPVEELLTTRKTVKTRFQETYKGLPVVGEALVLETDLHGYLTGFAVGSFMKGIKDDLPDTQPVLVPEEVMMVAAALKGCAPNQILWDKARDVKLVVYITSSGQGQLTARLCYDVTLLCFKGSGPPSRSRYKIDAKSGDILQKIDTLEGFLYKRGSLLDSTFTGENFQFVKGQGGNKKVGRYIYGRDYERLIVEKHNGMCKMENDHVKVVNLNHSTDIVGMIVDGDLPAYEFDCQKGANDYSNGAYSPINDAYYFFSKNVEMFKVWYKKQPLKSQVILLCHYGEEMENAFYAGPTILIGDGGKSMYPLVSASVIGHETSHGFTEEHSDLSYDEQSGAINEAFGDMAGEALEAFLDEPDWKVGSKVTKNKEALRFLSEPSRDEKSISDASQYCPGMDVHYSSGVYNLAFYRLANLPGWDVRKAFQVFLIANTVYWNENEDYASAACGVVSAAEDLGDSRDDVLSVFRSVGIEPCQSKRYGIANNFELKEDQGGAKIFKLFLERHHGEIWIQTRYGKGKLVLEVEGSGRKHTSADNGTVQEVVMENVHPGTYDITLQAMPNFDEVRLYAVLSTTFIATNVEAVMSAEFDSHIGEVFFELTEADVDGAAGLSLAIRITAPHNGFQSLTSWKTPVKLQSYIFQVKGFPLGNGVQEALYCHPKPGRYHVVVQFYVPFYTEYSVSYLMVKTDLQQVIT